MMELLQVLMGIAVIWVGIYFVWESSKMVDERNERRRNGSTDYYDNPIGKNDE